MAGGLLNIVSYGTSSLIVFGNPKKSLFRNVYKSITNFGMQRFRLDTVNENTLSVEHETVHRFLVKRNADLIGDTYLSIQLPDIWSPVAKVDGVDGNTKYTPYEFQWVRELGTTMINDVEIIAGGQTLAKYTGEYFAAIMHRDMVGKKELWNKMTGNIPELYDPANAFIRNGNYPNAFYDTNSITNVTNPAPSIRGRVLQVPLSLFFSNNVSMALPLVAIQYVEIYIQVRLKPLRQLFTVKIKDENDNIYRKALPTTIDMNIFFDPPRNNNQTGQNSNLPFDSNIHLLSTYYFLDEPERKEFTKREHHILVRDIHEHTFTGITGPHTSQLELRGLVTSLMFRFRRSDALERNEWTNYTNWKFGIPQWIENESKNYYNLEYPIINTISNTFDFNYTYNALPAYDTDDMIMKDLYFLFDGKHRENKLDETIYRYIEPYARSNSDSKEGLFYYNFSTNTDVTRYQPSGGMNVDNFEQIEMVMTTLEPLRVEGRQSVQICDEDGNVIGVAQNINDTFLYTYDLLVMEERVNVINITSGMIGLLYAR